MLLICVTWKNNVLSFVYFQVPPGQLAANPQFIQQPYIMTSGAPQQQVAYQVVSNNVIERFSSTTTFLTYIQKDIDPP